MNPTQALFQSILPLSQALTGGQAPSAWRRDLRQIQENMTWLWFDAAWVSERSHLSLHEEPLLGQALLELTEPGTSATTTHSPLSHTVTGQREWGTRELESTGDKADKADKEKTPCPMPHAPCPKSQSATAVSSSGCQ